jgi:hypothetical protein
MAKKTKDKSDLAQQLSGLSLAERALMRRVLYADPSCLRVDDADAEIAVRLWKQALLRPAMVGQRHAWRLAGIWAEKRDRLLKALLPD